MKYKKTSLILSLLLPFQILFIKIISLYPNFIEKYYANGIYPFLSKILRFLLGWIPFSLGDFLGLFLIFYVVFILYRLFKNRFKNAIATLLKITAILSTLYFCFYCFWGLNYFRKPLAENLELQQNEYTTEQLTKTTKKVITLLNHYHLMITKNDSVMVINPYTTSEIYAKAPKGFTVLSKKHPQLSYQIPSIKNSMVSLMHMYTGTSGYLNPVTGEAHVNSMIHKTGFPTTTCHEMAHQIGWSAENDANFVGFLASIANPDVYFNYAGYRMAYHYLIRETTKRDKDLSKKLWKMVNKGVVKDYQTTRKLWQQYENPIEPYLKKGYSSYLKANNQSKGIKSYSYVVDLFIAYDLKIGL